MQAHDPAYDRSRAASTGRAGFTLIEVCLALGIIAFAVLPLVGLLSIGLSSYRNAVVRARATQVLNQIATALRDAIPAAGNSNVTAGTYVALAPLPQPGATPDPNQPSGTTSTPITWVPAATAIAQPYTVYFDENGTYISDTNSISAPSSVTPSPPANARIAVGLILTPPTTTYTPGTAQLTAGWPATAQTGPFYTAPSFSYGTVQGHVENTITLPAISAQQ